MPKGLLGRKVGMTQIHDESGKVMPVTVIEVGPCVVMKVCEPGKEGYSAVQLGFADKPRRLASRAERGQCVSLGGRREKARQAAGVAVVAKPECEPKRFVREFRTEGEDVSYTVGQVLTVDEFQSIPRVDVIGVSKGRGFAGAMKRHNFSGLCASHGVKKVHRSMGSTGQRQDPGRVFKGQKMPGHMGNERVTVRHLKVVKVDVENNLLLVWGGVPGPNGGYVMVRETNCY
jgi:large subunit ribosomal protein L3